MPNVDLAPHIIKQIEQNKKAIKLIMSWILSDDTTKAEDTEALKELLKEIHVDV